MAIKRQRGKASRLSKVQKSKLGPPTHGQQATEAVRRKLESAKLWPVPDTEVEAYDFIRRALRDLGWVVKNPSLNTGGNVWTQNQCFGHPEIKLALDKKRPENIIKLSETLLWVIEAKASRLQLDQAVDEAVNYYAGRINSAATQVRAVMATGVAGSEDAGYSIRTKILIDGTWHVVTINLQVATGLLSPDDIRLLLEGNTSDVHEFSPPQRLFLQAAERINAILHMGGINRNERAKTMAALLLSVIGDPPKLDTSLPVLIGDINTRSQTELEANNKTDFADFMRILPPTNKTNHVKFKNALVKTIQELLNLNIRSAMNSSTDILGQFYEVFLKYGNGAKDIGIVLTPRHITRFAVEALGVSYADTVLDVACGTGGFLVAAFDHVRRTCTGQQLEAFKKYNLFGVEEASTVAVLAIVNMIFRGDGKNNISEGDCFKSFFKKRTVKGHASAVLTQRPPIPGEEAITRVLMNPPFALKGSIYKEYRFVSHALSLMVDGGLLFSLLPLGAMFRDGKEKAWRKDELLAKHTLLAVISLPEKLFTPAANKQVIAVIVKKGIPHTIDQPVFWGRIERDGHLMVKARRLPASELKPLRVERDDIEQVLPPLRSFVSHPTDSNGANVAMRFKTAPVDFIDPLLELIPEAYLDSEIPSQSDLQSAVDNMVRETAAFLVRFSKEDKAKQYEAN